MTCEVKYNLNFKDYSLMDGEHASHLKLILKSPRHYKRYCSTKETDAMILGRLVHSELLEPGLNKFCIWEKANGSRRGKIWEDFCNKNLGLQIITEEQKETLDNIIESVRSHKIANDIFNCPGKPEISIFWEDKNTSTKCKSRIDRLNDMACLIELKTTKDPSTGSFARQIINMGYLFQLAFYRRACFYAFGISAPVVIVAVQNQEPFDVVVYEVNESILIEGEKQINNAFELLKKCRENNFWPGVSQDKIEQLVLPDWAFNERLEDLEDIA